MKTFDQLSVSEQSKAINYFYDDLISTILELGCFPENLVQFQDILKDAVKEADLLQTPWFVGEIFADKLERNPFLQERLLLEAKEIAKQALYQAPDELVVLLD